MIHPIPYADPIAVFAPFAQDNFAILLHSSGDSPFARYSFIAIAPEKVITAKKGDLDPFSHLKDELQQHKCPASALPFPGGIAGYFAYELGTYLENIPRACNNDFNLPDMCVGVYHTVAVYDHFDKKAYVISPSSDHPFINPQPLSPISDTKAQNLDGQFTQDEYAVLLQKTIEHIYAGDIYQANITRRFTADISDDFSAFDLFRRSTEINPAPFSAYLKYPDFTIVSASPERFIKLDNGHVETRPIKGTRRRSKDPIIDEQLKQDLKKSEKDKSENLMIVDLMRNDISRVCKPHTVKVPELFALESYATVHHLVSSVVGELKPEHDAIDLLRATFPGGSITGTPKIRAMEIISDLEPYERGVYCGSIGYLGFDGSMDTNIAIRTFVVTKDRVVFNAGGAIVADSCSQAEYEETTTKASALIRCIS